MTHLRFIFSGDIDTSEDEDAVHVLIANSRAARDALKAELEKFGLTNVHHAREIDLPAVSARKPRGPNKPKLPASASPELPVAIVSDSHSPAPIAGEEPESAPAQGAAPETAAANHPAKPARR